MKTCTKCKKIIKLSKFYYREDRNVYESRCIKCTSEYRKCLYAKDKEKYKTKSIEWYHDNKEAALTRIKKWRENNKRKCNKYRKKWLENNPDKRKLSALKWMYKSRYGQKYGPTLGELAHALNQRKKEEKNEKE